VRTRILILVGVIVSAGCSGHGPPAPKAAPGTLEALWNRPGENVSLVGGDADFARGPVRYSFLVVTHRGKAVERPRARVWISRGLKEKPFAETSATLEPVGVPGAGDPLDVKSLYVAHFRIPRPGTYWVLAEPAGGRIQGVGNVVVKARSDSPAVGARAFPSRTPTLGSARIGRLTTRTPPDRDLLRYSIAGSLAARAPFVVVFATPKFCASRTCGPVVDVVEHVARRFPAVRFVHVEIYRDNDPAKGSNRWVEEWRLPSEPWIFLVGRDGRIKAKFEGSVSPRELAGAVGTLLAPR